MVTLIKARWIVPVDSDKQHAKPYTSKSSDLLINHGAIAIKDNRIVDLGKVDHVMAKFDSNDIKEIIDLSVNHLLMPGLINCHTHCAMSILRGYADDVPLSEWLEDYIWPTEEQVMSDEFVYEGTAIATVEALKSGTTMLNDMYFRPQSAIRAFKEAGIRAVCSPGMLNLNDGSIERQFHESHRWLQEADKLEDLVRPSFTPHSLYTVEANWHQKGVEMIREIEKHNVVYHTHLHETISERTLYEKVIGKSALESLYEVGALNEKFVGAHCVHLNDHEIEIMAKTKANVCHCPKSNLKLASGFCPVAKYLKAGINVCLGTDGGCSNNSLDMLSEIQFAALLAKGVSMDTTAVDAYTVIQMATRNGARALGRLHDLGSLEIGKLADIVAVDLVGCDELGHPIYDPISHLVYTTHRQVTDVWIDGNRVMKSNQIQTIKLNSQRLDNLITKITKVRDRVVQKKNSGQTTPTTTTSEV